MVQRRDILKAGVLACAGGCFLNNPLLADTASELDKREAYVVFENPSGETITFVVAGHWPKGVIGLGPPEDWEIQEDVEIPICELVYKKILSGDRNSLPDKWSVSGLKITIILWDAEIHTMSKIQHPRIVWNPHTSTVWYSSKSATYERRVCK